MEKQINELAGQLLHGYQTVQQLLEKMKGLESNVEKSEAMVKVNSVFTQIKRTETQLYPLRDQYLSAGNSLSQETRQLLENSADIVKSLIPHVNALEKQAQDDRDKLAPAIHEGVRGIQMQSAYSQYQ